MTNTVKIPGDEVRAILENIAMMRVGNGWELRSIPDANFKVFDIQTLQCMLH